MGFLDKLKPQPRWKHADAAVRLEAVRELDEPEELATVAETDSDIRVRRAAIAKLEDAAALGRVASSDPDDETRDRAADRLVALASRNPGDTEPAEAGEAPGLAAVRSLTDSRRLSTVAKSDAPEAVRLEALARVREERALGSIARHARHQSTATQALVRLSDPSELLDVTLHSDHKDVALAAFERLVAHTPVPDLVQLRSIEVRAHQKAVSRGARTMIQDIESAEAARQTAALERQRRESMLCDAVEQLAEVADVAVARGELARLSDQWSALEVTDQTALDRFARAAASTENAIAARQREADEAADRQRARAEAIATRIALCERVETLDGDDVLEQLVPIEEEWRALLPLVGNGPEADRLAERFALAVAACRKRHGMGALLVETRTTLEARVAEAETLVSLEDAGVAAARWQVLSREARGLTGTLHDGLRPADDLIERLRAVDAVFASRHAEADAEAEKAREGVLVLIQRLTDRSRRVAEAETVTLREGDRLMRDIAAGLELVTHAGSSPDLDRAAAELREVQEKVAPRVRDLREMDDWRRFANAQRQEQLIALAEAIVASLKTDEEAGTAHDLAATAKALRQMHTEWQQVAEAPRQTAQRLWDRFRTATDFIRSRCEPYFAKRREERHLHAQRRTEITTESEQLAASTDWANAAARFQELQTEWQGLGPLAGDAERQLAQRFRTSCNTFFARRREDLLDRKKVWSENLARKEALCVRAEELSTSTEWDAAASEMKRLQADWKTIGPVRKNKSEQVWTRFRAAADRFFERYHSRHEIALASKLAEREAIVSDLETLAASTTEAPANLTDEVQRLRALWNQSVPVPVPGMKSLADRWQTALGSLLAGRPDAFTGTDLDPRTVVHRMEKLVARVESLAGAPRNKPEPRLSPTEQLAAKLRSALASNAMGGRTSGDESQAHAAADAVRDAQAAWQRLPPVDTAEVRTLEARFRDACRRIQDQTRRGGGGHQPKREPREPSEPRSRETANV